MPVEVFMPALGAGQETGTVVTWLKSEGDSVQEGEPLMEVETDKSTVVLEAPASGVLAAVGARAGDEVPVGTVIAQILGDGESPPEPSSSAPGRIVEADLVESESAKTDITSPLWRAMATNVTRSWQEIPHFYLVRTVVADALVEVKSRQPHGVTYTDLFVRNVARTLRRHPLMNAGSASVNIGLAVGTDSGLLVPVIHEADRLDLEEIAARRAAVVERCKQGKMQVGDLDDATFTISNLGMYGIDLFIAIVSEGQAGILAIGRIIKQPISRGDALESHPTTTLSLSCDHRLVDGLRAAQFLHDLADALEAFTDLDG